MTFSRSFIACLSVFACLSLSSGIFAGTSSDAGRKTHTAKPYPQTPYVDPQTWEMLKPYFLPEDHPIRPSLDKIFSSSRVTLFPTSFGHAGFKTPEQRKYSRTMVSKHPKLKGYIVKAYPDTEKNLVDWEKWLIRIKGAQSLQNAIDINGFKKYFKVPKKWIYPLPPNPSPPNNPLFERKNFILICEDMNIYSHNKSKHILANKMSAKMLDALFVLLRDEQLVDSVAALNIPFSKDGRIAFIDTEQHHKGVPDYARLNRYLNMGLRMRLKFLIQNNGPEWEIK